MAFIRLNTGQGMVLKPQQARELWNVFVGNVKGTPEQRAFVKKVKTIYLNPDNAPKDYLAWRRDKLGIQQPLPLQPRLPYAD